VVDHSNSSARVLLDCGPDPHNGVPPPRSHAVFQCDTSPPRQVASALAYLHTHEDRIVHRDLHIRNVMTSRFPAYAHRAPHGVYAVLGDFNRGKRLAAYSQHTAYAGLPAIVPPECRNARGDWVQ
jgi:hypothetical protein